MKSCDVRALKNVRVNMSVLDEIEAAKNVITGGSAEVSIDVNEVSLGEPVKVTVRAKVGDLPIDIDQVYVLIRGVEEVTVPNMNEEFEGGCDEVLKKYDDVSAAHQTFEIKTIVANAQKLAANQSYEWQAETMLPDDAQPSPPDQYRKHTYQAFAGLDCFGNDPDSGWVELEVR